MIVGIGVDLVDARRIEDSVTRFERRFLDRIFTADEQRHAFAAARPHLSLAKRFAAKEAVAKALGTGVRGFLFVDIEVTSDALGKPHVLLHAGAAARLRAIVPEGCTAHVHLSLSDEDPYASAYAIIESI
ncbi:holo-ACP synthase [Asticcacaulis sp. AC402]|uniref:holo-ACP synthase n=1 Tax=Asticcacaulis sp. AC402 TaxID=1282361 RepID=UPI0003C3FCFE|nr:holo-ACP synthase [Asticcacaulis sp. AC402]ESQ76309.1 ACP synthase [Asticcacaulis sp. AC402]